MLHNTIQLSPNFSLSELTHSQTAIENAIDNTPDKKIWKALKIFVKIFCSLCVTSLGSQFMSQVVIVVKSLTALLMVFRRASTLKVKLPIVIVRMVRNFCFKFFSTRGWSLTRLLFIRRNDSCICL